MRPILRLEMSNVITPPFRVALLWHGDRAARDSADVAQSRFAGIANALTDRGIQVEPAVYDDDFANEVLNQILQVDAVQVWVNPIVEGRDRTVLDELLRKASDKGVLVSAHPNVIQKMGTKEVVYRTKGMSWGSDVDLYESFEDIKLKLPEKLARGARVLKLNKGHSGGEVWKVEIEDGSEKSFSEDTRLLFRHAQRGSKEECIIFAELRSRFKPYFDGDGKVIDQAYQERLVEGMVRCYMVSDEVAGFGHQEINALFPAPSGSTDEPPEPGSRLYHPPGDPRFVDVKSKMEREWLPELMNCLDVSASELPLLWDADFFLGEKSAAGADTYVLCEINVSSVAPFPDSAIEPFARKMRERLILRSHN